MFEEPAIRPVCRSQAFTSSSSPTHSSSSHACRDSDSGGRSSPLVPAPDIIPPQATFEYHEIHVQGDDHDAPAPPTELRDQTFSFRLFAPKSNSTHNNSISAPSTQKCAATGITRVNIRSPTPLTADGEHGGGFLVPFRPKSYYFTSPSSAEGEGSEFARTAVSGEEVRKMAQCTAWPGTNLPWRVIQLPASGLTRSAKAMLPSSVGTGTKERSGRKAVRAGKKRRIAIRKKHAAEARAVETDKGKRSRRNREKKLKKQEKNRKMKMEGTRGAGKEPTGGGDGGGSDDGDDDG